MKLKSIASGVIIILLFISSCSKSGSVEGVGPSTLNVSLIGVDSDNESLGNIGRSNIKGSTSVNSDAPSVQSQVIPFSDGVVLRVSFEEVNAIMGHPERDRSSNSELIKSSVASNNSASKEPYSLGDKVRYSVLVYQDDLLVDEKSFVHGEESTQSPFALYSNVDYVFVAYSKNSISELPVIVNKNKLSTAQVSQESGNLMFFKETKKLNVGTNNLKILLKHKFTQITTNIAVGPTFLGSIKSIGSTTISGTVDWGSINFLNQAITYSSSQVVRDVLFPNVSGISKSIQSAPVILISPAITTAKMNIFSLRVNDVTNPVEITGLKVNPGKKYNLNLTFDSPCLVDVGGGDASFDLSNGISDTISAPAADYGFVFNVTELDNSFGLNVNGLDLFQVRRTIQTSTRTRTRTSAISQWPTWGAYSAWVDSGPASAWSAYELEFENVSPTARKQNIQYADGNKYGSTTPAHDDIWLIKGTTKNPAVRVVISEDGDVSLFGAKKSNGPLFPLRLITSYYTDVITANPIQNGNRETQTRTRVFLESRINNAIVWRSTQSNTVIATQFVQGPTYMKGSGGGKRKIDCAN